MSLKLTFHRLPLCTGQYNHIDKQYNTGSSTQGLIEKAALSVANLFIPVSLNCNKQFWNLLGVLTGVCCGQSTSSTLACQNSYFLNHIRIRNRRMVFMELDYSTKI
jgi:hypothetical protein